MVKCAFAGTQQAREIKTDSFSGISPVTGLSLTVSRITESVAGQILSLKETSRGAKSSRSRLRSCRVVAEVGIGRIFAFGGVLVVVTIVVMVALAAMMGEFSAVKSRLDRAKPALYENQTGQFPPRPPRLSTRRGMR